MTLPTTETGPADGIHTAVDSADRPTTTNTDVTITANDDSSLGLWKDFYGTSSASLDALWHSIVGVPFSRPVQQLAANSRYDLATKLVSDFITARNHSTVHLDPDDSEYTTKLRRNLSSNPNIDFTYHLLRRPDPPIGIIYPIVDPSSAKYKEDAIKVVDDWLLRLCEILHDKRKMFWKDFGEEELQQWSTTATDVLRLVFMSEDDDPRHGRPTFTLWRQNCITHHDLKELKKDISQPSDDGIETKTDDYPKQTNDVVDESNIANDLPNTLNLSDYTCTRSENGETILMLLKTRPDLAVSHTQPSAVIVGTTTRKEWLGGMMCPLAGSGSQV